MQQYNKKVLEKILAKATKGKKKKTETKDSEKGTNHPWNEYKIVSLTK